jgi:hypothetical protein
LQTPIPAVLECPYVAFLQTLMSRIKKLKKKNTFSQDLKVRKFSTPSKKMSEEKRNY